jgi:hypothetical protein
MHADVENAPAPVVESAFAEPAADHGPIGGSSTKPAASEAKLKQSRNMRRRKDGCRSIACNTVSII